MTIAIFGEHNDAIVSIEMLRQLAKNIVGYFECVQRCLKPQAKALIQTITIDETFLNAIAREHFIQQYIFPGGMLPSPERFMAHAAKYQMDARIVLALDSTMLKLCVGGTRPLINNNWGPIAQQVRHALFNVFGKSASRAAKLDLKKRTDVYQFLLQKKA